MIRRRNHALLLGAALGLLLVGAGPGLARAPEGVSGLVRPPDEPAVDLSITDSEVREARRWRDLVMPKLWARAGDSTHAPLAAVDAYAPLGFLFPAPPPEPAFGSGGSGESPDGDNPRGLSLLESIETALEHNLRLQVARLVRDAASNEVDRAKAKFHPVVGVSYTENGQDTTIDSAEGTTATRRTRTANAFVSEEIPTGGQVLLSGEYVRDVAEGSPRDYSADVTISIVQPVLRGAGFEVARQVIRNAEFDRDVEEARLRSETLNVIAETKTAYFNTILAEKIIEVTSEAVERDKALIEASEALFQAGLVTKRDVFSAQILLAKDKSKLVSAEADFEISRNVLLETLGLPITARVELVDKDISFDPLSQAVDRWVATAIRYRPEVLEVHERLEKSRLNLNVARNGRHPQVDLVASYGLFENGVPKSDIALDLGKEAWSAGVVFSMPLGNAEARAAANRARLELEALERELLDTKRKIELEVRETAIKLRENLGKMEALEVGVEQARGKLEIAKERFALGLATNLDITDAQEDLLNAETDLLTAIVDYNIGLAELEARIAGPTS